MMTGRQKAALLLSTLEPTAAAELLRGVDEVIVKDLAVEIAYFEASGQSLDEQTFELAREFCSSLEKGGKEQKVSFVDRLLKSSLGAEKAATIQTQIADLLNQRDPFLPLKKATNNELVAALNIEHPQAAAVVLSEFDAKRSSEIISQLKPELRADVVSRMIGTDNISVDARKRIAFMVVQRLEAMRKEAEGDSSGSAAPAAQTSSSPEAAASPDKLLSYRKVSVVVRNLAKELRDAVLASVCKTDPDAHKLISDLMIIWEDIPMIADRSLQNSLRGIDPQKMALALMNADPRVVARIYANISERAKSNIEEEKTLITSPKKEDMEQAREIMLTAMRELNAKGELNFVE